MRKSTRFLPFFLILVIGLVAFRFMFFISFTHIQKSEFRRQLLKTNNGKIIELEFSEADLYVNKDVIEWKEQNRELVIKGVYHEVIHVKKMKGRAIVSVIPDKAENELFEKFFSLNKTLQHDLSDLIKLFSNLICINTSFQIKPDLKSLIARQEAPGVHFVVTNYGSELIKPPELL